MNIEYKGIYDSMISEKSKGVIIDYSIHNATYNYLPFSHFANTSALDDLYDLIIDNVVFYAFSENEILNLQENMSLLDDLRNAAKYAFAVRLPKRLAANSDGTLGEVLLDLLLQVFEPQSQKLVARAKHVEVGKKSEITGYDALYFTKQNDEITLWLGQAKAGQRDYCKTDIKKDLNNKFKTDYFAETAFYIADRSDSSELTELLNEINKVCFLAQVNSITKSEKIDKLYQILTKYNVKIKIPCLLAYTCDIYSAVSLQESIESVKQSIVNTFDSQTYDISIKLPYDIRFYIFPIKDVSYIRDKISELKREVV